MDLKAFFPISVINAGPHLFEKLELTLNKFRAAGVADTAPRAGVTLTRIQFSFLNSVLMAANDANFHELFYYMAAYESAAPPERLAYKLAEKTGDVADRDL